MSEKETEEAIRQLLIDIQNRIKEIDSIDELFTHE